MGASGARGVLSLLDGEDLCDGVLYTKGLQEGPNLGVVHGSGFAAQIFFLFEVLEWCATADNGGLGVREEARLERLVTLRGGQSSCSALGTSILDLESLVILAAVTFRGA